MKGSSLPRSVWVLLATLAVAFPTVIAFNVSPSATFFNQAAAFIGWGSFLLGVGGAIPRFAWPGERGMWALLVSLGILVSAALCATLFVGAPGSLSLSSAGTMLAGVMALVVGANIEQAGSGDRAFAAFCIALTIAGIASSLIGLIQVFAPNLPDGDWIAAASIPGRATGNLRQPNHLSSLLLWSIVAVMWLGERRTIYREIAAVLTFVFVWVVMLSASRTGAIGVATLAAWGLIDRRLSRSTRWVLVATPLMFAVAWAGTALWSHATHGAFGAESRFQGSGIYVSYSRYAVWANALSMIAMHPWLGVGFGEFNFAWTLTPFPGRPVAFFDHAHNIALQFAVELGLPLATLVLALMGYALWRALRNAIDSGRIPGAHCSTLFRRATAADAVEDGGSMQRAAFVMVLMVGMHSLLEYPLWYAYFLLPAAFAFGLCLEKPAENRSIFDSPAPGAPAVTRPYVLAAMALIFGGTFALYDYMRVVVIFAPPGNAGPLEQRIADGQHSIFFGHHADYAAATVSEHPGQAMQVFKRAPHFLLDARLMQAWATALNENGETDKASYVAQRLKEFRNEQSDEFFAPCAAAAASQAEKPFQCRQPQRPLTFKDFR